MPNTTTVLSAGAVCMAHTEFTQQWITSYCKADVFRTQSLQKVKVKKPHKQKDATRGPCSTLQ